MTLDSDDEAEKSPQRLQDIDSPRKATLTHTPPVAPTPTTTTPVTASAHPRPKAYSFDEPIAQGTISPNDPSVKPIQVQGKVLMGVPYIRLLPGLVYLLRRMLRLLSPEWASAQVPR